ncbi:hypothetical protein D3C81_1315140 [compost metagenome]
MLDRGTKGRGAGDGVDHQGKNDVGSHGHHGFHVRPLLVGIEFGIGHRHHFDVQVMESVFGTLDEGTRPVGGGVHQDGGRVMLGLDPVLLGSSECYLGIRGWLFAIGPQSRGRLGGLGPVAEQHGGGQCRQ